MAITKRIKSVSSDSRLESVSGIGGEANIALKTKTLQDPTGNEVLSNVATTEYSIEDQLAKVNNDINNSIYQLNAMGITEQQFQDEVDNRNFIYKTLGFREDTSLAINILDLLNRPANSVRGLLNGYDASGAYNPTQAMIDGFTNQKEYGAEELLKNTGLDISDWPTLMKLPFTLAASIATDPLTYWNAPIRALTTGLKSATRGLKNATVKFMNKNFGQSEWYQQLTELYSLTADKFKEVTNLWKFQPARVIQQQEAKLKTILEDSTNSLDDKVVKINGLLDKGANEFERYYQRNGKNDSLIKSLYEQASQNGSSVSRFIDADDINTMRNGKWLTLDELSEINPNLKQQAKSLPSKKIMLENGTEQEVYAIHKGWDNFTTEDWKQYLVQQLGVYANNGVRNLPVDELIRTGKWKELLDANNIEYTDELADALNAYKNKKTIPLETQKKFTELYTNTTKRAIEEGIDGNMYLLGHGGTYVYKTFHENVNLIAKDIINTSQGELGTFVLSFDGITDEGNVKFVDDLLTHLSALTGKSKEVLASSVKVVVPKNKGDATRFVRVNQEGRMVALQQTIKDKYFNKEYFPVVYDQDVKKFKLDFSGESSVDVQFANQTMFDRYGLDTQVQHGSVIYSLSDGKRVELPFNNVVEQNLLNKYADFERANKGLTKANSALAVKLNKKIKRAESLSNYVTTNAYDSYDSTIKSFDKLFTEQEYLTTKYKYNRSSKLIEDQDTLVKGNKQSQQYESRLRTLNIYDGGEIKYQINSYKINDPYSPITIPDAVMRKKNSWINISDNVRLLQVVQRNKGKITPMGYRFAIFADDKKTYKSLTKWLQTQMYKNETKVFENWVRQAQEVVKKVSGTIDTRMSAKLAKKIGEQKVAAENIYEATVSALKDNFNLALNNQDSFFLDMVGLYGTKQGIKGNAFKQEFWDSMNMKLFVDESIDDQVRYSLSEAYNKRFDSEVVSPYQKQLAKFTDEQITTLKDQDIFKQGSVLVFENNLTQDIKNVAKLLDDNTAIRGVFKNTNQEINALQTMIEFQIASRNLNPLNDNGIVQFNNIVKSQNIVEYANRINRMHEAVMLTYQNKVQYLTNEAKLKADLTKELLKINKASAELYLADEVAKQQIISLVPVEGTIGLINAKVNLEAYNDLMTAFGKLTNEVDYLANENYFTKLQTSISNLTTDTTPYLATPLEGTDPKKVAAVLESERKHLQSLQQDVDNLRVYIDQQNKLVREGMVTKSDNRLWYKQASVATPTELENLVFNYLNQVKRIFSQTKINADLILNKYDANGNLIKQGSDLFKYYDEMGDGLHQITNIDDDFVAMKRMGIFPDDVDKIVNATFGNDLNRKLITKSNFGAPHVFNKLAGADLIREDLYQTLAMKAGYNAKALERYSLLETSMENGLIKQIDDSMLEEYMKAKNITSTDLLTQENFNEIAKSFDGNSISNANFNEFEIVNSKTIETIQQHLDLFKGIAGREYGMDNISQWVNDLEKMVNLNPNKVMVHKSTLSILNRHLKQSASLFNNSNKFWSFAEKYLVKPFKAIATFSIGFHAKNLMGNYMNAYLAGVNPIQLTKHSNEAYRDITNIKRVFLEFSNELATNQKYANVFTMQEIFNAAAIHFGNKVDDLKYFKMGYEYLEKGLWGVNKFNDDIATTYSRIMRGIKDKSQSLSTNQWVEWMKEAGTGMKNMFQKSFEIGSTVDSVHKLAVYKYAQTAEGIKTMNSLGMNSADDFAKYVFFDYNNLSHFERNVMKKIMPFYTWMRKNVEFHLKNFAVNSKRYTKVLQAYNGWVDAFTDSDEELSYNKYSKLPIWDNGNGKIIYINLDITPLSALESITTSNWISSLNPLFKWPLEQLLGINTFSGQSNREFEYLPFGLDNVWKIPQYIFQTISGVEQKDRVELSNLGLIGNKFVNMFKSAYNWFTIGDPNWTPANWFPSLLTEFDTQKIQLNNRIKELQKLSEYLNQLRNAGKYVPSVQDILPNQLGYVKPKYRAISPRYTLEQLNRLIKTSYQKDYKS